ncbi:MAG: TRAP transporter substrate-binding protein [Albidovulum sp.]|nr:TRAP transporter substrate-binding protein [Albidovulum sp.]
MKTRHPLFKSTAAVAFGAAMLFSPAAANAQEKLLFAEADTVGSLLNLTNIMFAELVSERSGGALALNHVQGSQLGNDTQVIEQMIEGSVDIYGDVLGWYAKWEDDFNILNWGFTFDDADHMQKFIESELFAEIAGRLRESNNIHILAAAPTEARELFAKPVVSTPDDLVGVKMRVPGIQTYVLLWETLGASPARVAWAEVFLGLKTGTIEAAEGPPNPAYAQKFHQGTGNVMLTNHVQSTMQLSMNAERFDSLSPEMQKILTEAAQESVA